MSESSKKVKAFAEERGWHDQVPANIAKSISIEAAEVLEHFQWNDPSSADLKANPEELEKVSKEIADVLIYCYHMTNVLGLDPDEIVDRKLAHAAKKYPIEKVKGPDNKGNYKKIQQEWRQKGIN